MNLDQRTQIVLDLKKDRGIPDQMANVALVLDFSVSMGRMYTGGSVDELIGRVVPLALAFDANKAVDAYLFHDSVHAVGEITKETIVGFGQRMVKKYEMGGTKYAPAIKAIMKKYRNQGLFGMGKKKPMALPAYVLFVTDGDNFDHTETEQAIVEASEYGIFFQFIGIGTENFGFLQRLDTMRGRFLDNANFFKADDINAMDEDVLYRKLLGEFSTWVPQARSKEIILSI